MSTQKPGLPDTPLGFTPKQREFIDALRVNLEVIMGRRGTKIAPLSSNAQLSDVINTVNQLLTTLQG